ncbi:unnamed protein product [Brachionus calyciflorus]|uniref:Uncharacterized protein n=1 Tax=Brachionus calyciflorus TaxID=104777 RepID=A0A813QKT4_9BILA|nr:unnamed protein product [Brachionus calyciflorus]
MDQEESFVMTEGLAQINENDNLLVNELNRILETLNKSSNYSVSGEAIEFNFNPNIEIEKFGSLNYPVSESQADQLINYCDQVQCSDNFETLDDQILQNVYQIDQCRIQINNQEWNEKLQILVDRVTRQLGCLSKCQAKLNKMLLFKTGAHISKHRNMEKKEKNFATLILDLPCGYTGGELILYENEKRSEKVIGFEHTVEKINFIAHYADLENEFAQVKSGYRLILVYSIYWTEENADNDFVEKKVENLSEIISGFNSDEYRIGILLDHNYPIGCFTSNGIRALTGIDFNRYHLLNKANELLPEDKKLNFYIAHASYETSAIDISGAYLGYESDDSIESTFDPDFPYEWKIFDIDSQIKEVYDSKGNVYNTRNDLFFNRKSFLRFESFTHLIDPTTGDSKIDLDDLKNWGENVEYDFKGFNGDSGPFLTALYHKYILVILNKSFAFESSLVTNLNYAVNMIYDSIDSQINIDHVSCLLEALENGCIHSECWIKLIKIITKLNDLTSARHLIYCITDPNIEYSFELAKLVQNYGYGSLEDILTEVIQSEAKKQSILFSCNFVQDLLRLGMDEDAYKFFKETVLYFAKMQKDKPLKSKIVKQFATVFGLFVQRDETLKDLHQDFVDLTNKRIDFLREKLLEKPEITWCMPDANFPKHPKVEEFFHGSEREFEYKDIQEKGKAINFIAKYGAYQKGYSCEMDLISSKTGPIIKVVKNREIFRKIEKEFKSYEDELEKLMAI